MAKKCEKISKFSGEIETRESYFGAKRVRGKRGRGAGGKASIRNVKTRWQGLQNCLAGELLPILREYSKLEIQPFLAILGKLMTDLWITAQRLAATKTLQNEFVNGRNHINGIESF